MKYGGMFDPFISYDKNTSILLGKLLFTGDFLLHYEKLPSVFLSKA